MKKSSRWSSRSASVSSLDAERLDADRVVGLELESGQPAERGDVLVLLADRVAEPLDLDVAGRLGERAGRARAGAGCAYTARSRPTVNDPDEPRPVPAGMSATLTISMPGRDLVARRATSRIERVLDLVDALDALEHGVLERGSRS